MIDRNGRCTRATAVTAVLLAFGLAGGLPGAAMAQNKPLLVFVPNGASDFWKAANAGLQKAQAELPDFKLQLQYPQQATVAAQQQLMDDLVSAGAKGIMVSAVDPKTSTAGLDKVGGQLALFTTDSDAPQTNRVAYIGSSNVQAGLQAATIAKKALPHGGKCLGFVGLPGADNARERAEGFRQGIQGSGITLADIRSDEMDQARAKTNVSDALVARPDITCMVGIYSYNTPQIYAALKEAGQLGKITVIGFDGDPVTLGGVKEGSIAGTVVQQPYLWAYQGMKLMAAYVKGDKSGVPASHQIIIPTRIIDQSDVDGYVAEQQKMGG